MDGMHSCTLARQRGFIFFRLARDPSLPGNFHQLSPRQQGEQATGRNKSGMLSCWDRRTCSGKGSSACPQLARS